MAPQTNRLTIVQMMISGPKIVYSTPRKDIFLPQQKLESWTLCYKKTPELIVRDLERAFPTLMERLK
jgi:hypothetical protein